MRQFSPNPDLLQAISSFGKSPFRVTILRDRYIELYPTNKNKNDVRRWIYSYMRTFVKHEFLMDVTQKQDKAAHYQATEMLHDTVKPKSKENNHVRYVEFFNHTEFQKRLSARQHDILISLGATEELESLKTEFPELAPRIDQQLDAFKDQNVRTLGKIKALEALLVQP
ncbi:hypothetical protein BM528_01640 [Alteromonas sp. RW2A1]|jgi:hypothetical protein|uniref:hypothetical protein n=1 Tax=Alteromonas sp. RW2A1 TaxID=1917158 RepID=UPI000903BFE8|nr:hypothetical protein [Alteromonas sp. RW2A1]APE04641.1 hypothetical protein BM528_01640 [Alteromonas sp. RW2A1]